MDYKEIALKKHEEWAGKIEVISRVPVTTAAELSTAYTPGVAQPCLRIREEPALSYRYTRRHNMVAVISDGSAVLGLGNIGGLAGMPVMEGKCVLLKEFGDVDAFPIVLATQKTDEIIQTIRNIAPSFGGINLEDIAAPRCFEIENVLKESLDIPVFHDDQHGTAVVVLAALINAAKLTGKQMEHLRVCVCGAGAAGTAVSRLLLLSGVRDIVVVASDGILSRSNDALTGYKQELACSTNPDAITGGLAEAVRGRDVFIGVSKAGLLSPEMVRSMREKAVVLAMANPSPEILPQAAKKAGAYIIGTGRSDYPNQINNVLAFPGIFRGALDCRADRITEGMKIAAAHALAAAVEEAMLSPDCILPNPLNKKAAMQVAEAVRKQAVKEQVNRI